MFPILSNRSSLNVRLVYLYTLLSAAAFLLPVVVPYYRDEIGLNFHDFLIGEAVFATVVILLEVPTGWLADIWGRRKTLILAAMANFLGYATLLWADHLWQACLAQAIIGIAVSLNSGTLSAMLYDSLLSQNHAAEFGKREGFRHGLGLYAVATAALVGGFLYQIHHDLPIYAELTALAVAIVVAALMIEPARHQKQVEKHPIADMLSVMRYALHGHREIAVLIMITAMVFSTTKILLWAQQPYYQGLGVPESWFGVLLACGMLCGGFLSQMGHKVKPQMSGVVTLNILLGLIILFCFVASWKISILGLILLLSNSLFWGFGWPRVQETINHMIGSERRATILSTASFMISLAFIPLSLLFGWVEEKYGVASALTTHASIIAVLGGVIISFMILKRR